MLMPVKKGEAMAKIIIAGDACVITSGKKLEDIKMLEKYSPKALCLYGDDEENKKEVVFRVGTTDGVGSITKFGASFASKDAEGNATITFLIPQDLDGYADVKTYVAEKIGAAVMKLSRVEEQFNLALQTVEAERNAIMEQITVM